LRGELQQSPQLVEEGRKMCAIFKLGCWLMWILAWGRPGRLDLEFMSSKLLGKEFLHSPWTRCSRSKCKPHFGAFQDRIARTGYQSIKNGYFILISYNLHRLSLKFGSLFLLREEIWWSQSLSFLGNHCKSNKSSNGSPNLW
jgi:hypothetical protein